MLQLYETAPEADKTVFPPEQNVSEPVVVKAQTGSCLMFIFIVSVRQLLLEYPIIQTVVSLPIVTESAGAVEPAVVVSTEAFQCNRFAGTIGGISPVIRTEGG